MRILVSGGCKNGKSSYAQHLAWALAKGGRPLYYVATMTPVDGEDDERIARHRKEREGWGFVTVEQPRDIGALLDRCDPGGSFLIDSLTALLAGAMFTEGGEVDHTAPDRLCAQFADLLPVLSRAVIVSDYIYSDAHRYDPLTRAYRRGLAQVDRQVADICETVVEVAFGTPIVYKGAEYLPPITGGNTP